VVGKPAATVMTSSPGERRRAGSGWLARVATARRLALLPLFTSRAWGRAYQRASSASSRRAYRPAVSMNSSELSTRLVISSSP